MKNSAAHGPVGRVSASGGVSASTALRAGFPAVASVLLLALVAGPAGVLAGDVENLRSLLPGLAGDNLKDRESAQKSFEKICHRAARPGAEAERLAVCTAIAAMLGPGTKRPARVWMLKQLQYIGGPEVVAALARLLAEEDAQIRECARRALETNPAPKAAEVLRKALDRAESPEWRVAIANALGSRRDEESTGALARLLESSDQPVACAAAAALGKIGGPEAAKALSRARAKASGELLRVAADAYLLCADRFLAEGWNVEAAEIYKEMYSPSAPKLVRIAALQGLAAAKSAKGSERPARQPRRERPGRPGPSAEGAAPEVDSKAAASWDARLQARVREALKAGKGPSFLLKSMRMKVMVVEVAADGALKVAARGVQLGIPWPRLTAAEKKDLALAVAGGDPDGHAIVAFYLLSLGEKRQAELHLHRAGEAAKGLREMFE